MITYKDYEQYSRVYLDGKHVGNIMRKISGAWFYSPKGSKAAGDDMPTRTLVKRSIEGKP